MTRFAKFHVFGKGMFIIVLEGATPETGKPTDKDVEIPVDVEIKFKVFKKIEGITPEWEHESFGESRRLSVQQSHLKCGVDITFNKLEELYVYDIPPSSRNPYLLYCDDNKDLSGEVCFAKWQILPKDKKDVYKNMAKVRDETFIEYSKFRQNKIADDPLPEEIYPSPKFVNKNLFWDFINEHPKWKSLYSYITFRDNPKYDKGEDDIKTFLSKIMHYRFQNTYTCWAAVGMLTYTYVLSFGGPIVPMLNLRDAICTLYGETMKALEKKTVIKFIKDLFSEDTLCVNVGIGGIREGLETCGVVVITGLVKDVAFKDLRIKSHREYAEREEGSTHAVLCFGCREQNDFGSIDSDSSSSSSSSSSSVFTSSLPESSVPWSPYSLESDFSVQKQRFYLLQNTWEGKEIVEVSEHYLTKSSCGCFVVKNPKKRDELVCRSNNYSSAEFDMIEVNEQDCYDNE